LNRYRQEREKENGEKRPRDGDLVKFEEK